MGIYDREYYREDEQGGFNVRSMVVTLILANVAFFIANMVLENHVFGRSLFEWMALESNLFSHPWQAYQLVTYGFAHEPNDLRHLFFNMLFLWFAGSEVEPIYGRREFLLFYLASLIVGGLVYVLGAMVSHSPGVFGASGAVMAVMALFVAHFPRRTILLFLILPLPAYVVGIFYFASEILSVLKPQPDDNTAHAAHIAGAVFGYVYYLKHWRISSWLPSEGTWKRLKLGPRPKLRVHDPEEDEHDLQRRVDEILAKISRNGEASLTRQERKFLEDASRRYQRRRS